MNEILRKELEEIKGVHTTYTDENGNLVLEVEDNEDCNKLYEIANTHKSLKDANGNLIPTIVKKTIRPRAILPTYNESYMKGESSPNSFNITTHRDCHNVPMGGCQIAPEGAGWVGTLGGACSFQDVNDGKRYFGCITNWHVANGGRFGQGAPIGQPSGQGPKFGEQRTWEPIGFNNQNNVMDVAFIDCGIDGKHYILPEMIGLGKLNSSPQLELSVGMTVMKTGRTTGIQKNGRITATGVTTFVDYGNGNVGKFVNQIQIQQTGRDFSAAGDSGSLIVDKNVRPTALLFAGSGATTIASPLKPIIDKFKISFNLGQ